MQPNPLNSDSCTNYTNGSLLSVRKRTLSGRSRGLHVSTTGYQSKAQRAAGSRKTRILHSIKAIARDLRTTSKQSRRVPGVSTAQLQVLRALDGGPLSINDIADRTYTHQSSVSTVVGRLVSDKLVTRAASKADGRSVSVSLTAAGRGALRKSEDSTEVLLSNALNSLSRAELAALADCLEKVSSMLDRYLNEESMLEKSRGA